MKTRLLSLYETLRSSFWLVPTAMLLGAAALALAAGWLEGWLRREGVSLRHLWAGDAAEARSILLSVGASMISVTGIVFSMTMVALTLASSQLGPRLVRNFTRDTSTQVALGTFLSTFVFCLLGASRIGAAGDGEKIVLVLGLILAVTSLFVLVYFIHHLSVAIQAPRVVSRLRGELFAALDRDFPETVDYDDAPTDALGDDECVAIGAPAAGYIEAVDVGALLEFASARDLRLELACRPGHFVVRGGEIVRATPAERVDDDARREIGRAFVLRDDRRPTQDIEFTIDQIVEMALRALSPGVNDSFTALECLDHLSAFYAELARRPVPGRARRDDAGEVRVILWPTGFVPLLDAALHPLRQSATGNVQVILRILDVVGVVAECASREEDRTALEDHAERIATGARAVLADRQDLQVVETHLTRVLERLRSPPSAA